MGCGWMYRKSVGICTRKIKSLGNQSQAWGREDTAFFRESSTSCSVQRKDESSISMCLVLGENTFFFFQSINERFM
jgi:hypothetical protein